jgi:segregation and condensation protein B
MEDTPIPDEKTIQMVEALLFLENRPVHIQYIARITGTNKKDAEIAINYLDDRLKHTRSSLYIAKNESGEYYLTIQPDLYNELAEHYDIRKKLRLSSQALETLAIIAYKQPVTRIEIERIRGVAVGHVVRTLLEYELIRITGRKNVPGRPVLYGTTAKFLKYFGLLSLKDLPNPLEYETR